MTTAQILIIYGILIVGIGAITVWVWHMGKEDAKNELEAQK